MKIERTPKVKVNRGKKVTFRITDKMSNQIKELAKKNNWTISQYIRNILDQN